MTETILLVTIFCGLAASWAVGFHYGQLSAVRRTRLSLDILLREWAAERQLVEKMIRDGKAEQLIARAVRSSGWRAGPPARGTADAKET
jgi:hypothetical protein